MIRTHKNYLVHDVIGCHVGDIVCIVESKPISKRKRYVVAEILSRPSEAEVTASTIETESEVELEAEA